jgi:hypothetical protein
MYVCMIVLESFSILHIYSICMNINDTFEYSLNISFDRKRTGDLRVCNTV